MRPLFIMHFFQYLVFSTERAVTSFSEGAHHEIWEI